jgi:hypothetical protein
VTPRNAVRQAWNNQAALRHSFQTGNQIFVSPSVDEGLHADKDAMIWTADNKTEFLAAWSIICMNGPARVTVNEAIPLGIANGSRVIVREVIPHPSDYRGWQQVHDRRRIIKLEQPLIMVFVERIEEYDNTIHVNYHPQNNKEWFSMFTVKARITTPDEFHSNDSSFYRTQTPLTPAFALSD